MRAVKTCEFGHTMTLREVQLGSRTLVYYGHVHEDDALQCTAYAKEGWPDMSEPIWERRP